MTPPMQSSGSPLYMFVSSCFFGESCQTLVGRPLETTNRAPFLFIERAPPVFVSLYGKETLPFLSIFITSLFVFWAAKMPPSEVATMPSALFPVPIQIDFHFCPAAMTPGIAVTVISLAAGGPAAAPPLPAPPPPRAGPPPRPAGGFLQLFATKSAYPASAGACTPGPRCGAAGA